jgi:hypothetical protein
MRYTKPTIVATYPATEIIRSEKGSNQLEVDQIQLTAGPAYQSEE